MVSPAPFTGYSLMQGNRVKVMLFNPKLVTADQMPDTYEDFGNARYRGKYMVPPWSSTWEMGMLVYPRDQWLNVVDDAGKNAAGVLHFEGSLDRILSGDLPFAQSRFCGAEGLENVVNGSDFRNGDFGQAYGVRLVDGPLTGLFARAVVIVGEAGTVRYVQLVPEIAQEPDYDAALAALAALD